MAIRARPRAILLAGALVDIVDIPCDGNSTHADPSPARTLSKRRFLA